jgi:Na+-transporting methylmalonyl-CoA/oxaloacetate decarboxylase gamma subunit
MALLGIGTVFAALTVLVAALRLASRAVAAPEPHLARTLEPGGASVVQERGEDLELVALAAYALHLARRVRIAEPGTVSRWLLAGRMRQTAPFLRRESGERWLPTR